MKQQRDQLNDDLLGVAQFAPDALDTDFVQGEKALTDDPQILAAYPSERGGTLPAPGRGFRYAGRTRNTPTLTATTSTWVPTVISPVPFSTSGSTRHSMPE